MTSQKIVDATVKYIEDNYDSPAVQNFIGTLPHISQVKPKEKKKLKKKKLYLWAYRYNEKSEWLVTDDFREDDFVRCRGNEYKRIDSSMIEVDA